VRAQALMLAGGRISTYSAGGGVVHNCSCAGSFTQTEGVVAGRVTLVDDTISLTDSSGTLGLSGPDNVLASNVPGGWFLTARPSDVGCQCNALLTVSGERTVYGQIRLDAPPDSGFHATLAANGASNSLTVFGGGAVATFGNAELAGNLD